MAEAVCDRYQVDWRGAERHVAHGSAATIHALEGLTNLFPARAAPQDPGHAAQVHVPLGYRLILLLAAAHVAAGLVGSVTAADALPVPAGVQLTGVLVFAASAALLLWGGRHDSRPVYLGGFFLVVASALAVRFVPAAGGPVMATLATIRPEPFLPLLLWRFVREFPRVVRFSSADRVSDLARALSAIAGVALLVAGVLRPIVAGAGGLGSVLEWFGREGGPYWGVILGLLAPALPVAVLRSRAADPAERLRVRTFALVVAITLALPVAEILAEVLVPPFDAFVSPPEMRRRLAIFFYLALCATPVLATWVVLARRVFTLRLLVRRSLQWLLARGTLTALTLVPAAALAWHAHANRHLTLGDLLSGGTGAALLTLSAAAALLLWGRRHAAAAVDRYFSRTPRDHAGALGRLTARLQSVDHPREMARIVEDAVSQVLAPECVSLHLFDRSAGWLAPVRGRSRALPADSALATVLVADEASVNARPLERGSVFDLLPPADKDWVVDGPWALLTPIVEPARRVTGMIAVGPSRSDEPFRPADLTFLETVAATTSLALSRRPADAGVGEPLEDALAAECGSCGLVAPCDRETCACGEPLIESVLPIVLAGKFRVTWRLGRGAMGVVYRADDLVLARTVALKTLPRVSPDAALRLRREARSMALISHPNLAAIHGAESWRGSPVLVVEYLAGGTLESRLARGPLPLAAMVDLGLALLDALSHLHEAGYLHRDIKPSNIGFSPAGVPKLLDFGLATLAPAPVTDSPAPPGAQPGDRPPARTARLTWSASSPAGTPLYLAPEALAGGRPSRSGDLWALAVVLQEALTARHPLGGDTPREVLRRIRAGDVAPLPGWAPPVQAFFARALAPRTADRPSSASVLAAELQRLRDVTDGCSDPRT